MMSPPSLKDIDGALLSLRHPVERRLIQIQDLRDRFLESHRHSAAVVDPAFVEQSNRLRRSVREHQRSLDRLPQTVFRTLVVCDRDTEKLSAMALVPEETDTPTVTIGEWEVACVRCSFHLLRCQVGDVIPQGLVVSVNGSPVLAASQRRKTLEALRAPPPTPKEQKRRERMARGAKRERFIAERQRREDVLQEVFYERRRAIEEREKHLRDKLRRALDGPPISEPDPASLPAVDLAALADADIEPGIQPEPNGIEYLTGPMDLDAPIRSSEAPARTLDLGWVLAAFGVGCIAGLFAQPRYFSLVGALFAVIAALSLRILGFRRT
jgi:hypothetical protein